MLQKERHLKKILKNEKKSERNTKSKKIKIYLNEDRKNAQK